MVPHVPSSVCEKCAREFGEFLRTTTHRANEGPRGNPGRMGVLFGEDLPRDDGPSAPVDRIATESTVFDTALGGGLPTGSLLLARTQEGAGGVEFALTILRTVARRRSARRARFLTALRSSERACREAASLFENDRIGETIDFRETKAPHTAGLADVEHGDVVVVEDAASIGGGDPGVLDLAARELGEAAARTGALIILLESIGTLPALDQARLEAHADVVCEFRWSGTDGLRRRKLAVTKLRGLGPVLESRSVVVFELALKRGEGFEVAAITNVA